jgi:hypothetical protein
MGYPPVNIQKRTGKIHHAINGTIHYFDWAIFQFANCNKLPEGSNWIDEVSGSHAKALLMSIVI